MGKARQGTSSHFQKSYLDLGFWYISIFQFNQYVYKYWDGNAIKVKPIVCTLSTPRLQASFPRPHPSHDATSVDDDTTRRAIHPLPQRLSTPVTKSLVPPTILDADVSLAPSSPAYSKFWEHQYQVVQFKIYSLAKLYLTAILLSDQTSLVLQSDIQSNQFKLVFFD